MPRIIHARIDAETEKLFTELQRRMGWNDSKLVREGIKALNVLLVPRRPRKIFGLGRFSSGVPDLALNPKHREGFGE
jgi:hypothetical protein